MAAKVIHKLPCETGSAGWNGEEVGVTVSVKTTEEFDVQTADELLNRQRVDATLRITANGGEDSKQRKLVDDAHAEVRCEFDIGGFSRSEAEVAFRVKIPKDRLNGFHAEDFGPRTGLFLVHGFKPIPEKVKVTGKAAKGQKSFDPEGE